MVKLADTRKKREKIAVVRSQRIAWLGHVTGIREPTKVHVRRQRPVRSIDSKVVYELANVERRNSKRTETFSKSLMERILPIEDFFLPFLFEKPSFTYVFYHIQTKNKMESYYWMNNKF